MKKLLWILCLMSHTHSVHSTGSTFPDLDDYHSKVSLTARIFSGIALRIGLHDGSITESQLIPELLNLQLNSDDVANFDKVGMDRFFADLSGLSLHASAEVEKLEKKIAISAAVEEQFEKIVNLDDTATIDSYMDKLNAFAQQINTNFNFPAKLESAVAAALLTLNDIANGEASTVLKVKYDALFADLKIISEVSIQIEQLQTVLNANEELSGKSILESTLFRAVDAIKKFFNAVFSKTDQNVPKKVNDQLTLINGLATQFDAITPSLRAAIAIINLKISSSSSGFLHGFQDLSKLSDDVEDTWLSTVIDKYDPELTKLELKPLDQFNSSSTKLLAKWKDVGGSQLSDTLQTISGLFHRSRTSSFIADWTAMESKDAPIENNWFAEPVYELVENILKFRGHLNNFKAKLKRADAAKLNELIKFKDKINFDNGRTVQDVAADMPKKEAVDRLIKILGYFAPRARDFDKAWKGTTALPNLLLSLPAEILSKRGEVAVFMNDPTKKKFFEYFEFLKSIKSQLTSLSESVTLLRTIRSMQSDANFRVTLNAATSKISNGITDFTALRAVPGAIQQMNTSRIDELVQLKNIGGPAKTLGKAVMVLDTAHKMLSQKSDIEAMLEKGWDVSKNIASRSNNEDLANGWSNFPQLHIKLGALLAELEVKTSALTTTVRIKRQSTSLKDFVGKLAALQGLPDIDIDLKPMIKVLRQLNTLAGANEMRSTMEALDGLDLKFSAHQAALGSVKQEVGAAETLFGAIVKPTTAAPSGGESSTVAPSSSAAPKVQSPQFSGDAPSANAVSGSGSVGVSGTEEWSFGTLTIGVVGTLVAVAVVALIVYCACARCRKPPKKEPPKPAPYVAPVTPISSTPKEQKPDEDEHDEPEEPEPKSERKKMKKEVDVEEPIEKKKTRKEEEVDDSPIPPPNKLKLPFDFNKLYKFDQEDVLTLKQYCFANLEDIRQEDKKAKLLASKNPECVAEHKKFLSQQCGVRYARRERLGPALTDYIRVTVAPAEFEVLKATHDEIVQVIWNNNKFDTDKFAEATREQFFRFMANPWKLGMKEPWTIIEKRLVPPPLPTTYSFDFKRAFLVYSLRAEDKAKYRDIPKRVLPFHLRLVDVNEYVEGLQKPYTEPETKSHVRCFDHARFALSTGEFVNATVYDTSYAEYGRQAKIVIAATTGKFNKHDAVAQMLVELKPFYAVILGCAKYYENVPKGSVYTYTVNKETFDIDGHRDLSFQSVDIHKNGQYLESVQNLIIRRVTDGDAIRKDPAFRNAVLAALYRATRRNSKTMYNNEHVVFFDEEGGPWAGSVAGIEILAMNLNSQFTTAADVCLYLRAMLTRRGNMFTSGDQVMFTVSMALNMFFREHGKEELTARDWKNLEECRQMADQVVAKIPEAEKTAKSKTVDEKTKDATKTTENSKKTKKTKNTKTQSAENLKTAEPNEDPKPPLELDATQMDD